MRTGRGHGSPQLLTARTAHRPPSFEAPPDGHLFPKEAIPVATMIGAPVYCDDVISKTLSSNQDKISPPAPRTACCSSARTTVGLEALSAPLQARLQWRNYAAFIDRYPSSTATVGGTGLLYPTGF